MPILAAEANHYPAGLLGMAWEELSQSVRGDAPLWWVLHTKPRAEKAVARKLLASNLGFYLPVQDKPVRSRQGRQTSRVVAFPGYVFLFGDADARHYAWNTNQLVQCLPVSDQQSFFGELQAVERVLQVAGPVSRGETGWQTGQRVRIVAGPLEGLCGRWQREGKRGRFLVEVEMLRQGVSVELDSFMVEAIEDSRKSSLARVSS